MVNSQPAPLVAPSVAVVRTTLVPMGKTLPEAGTLTTATFVSQSMVPTVNSAAAPSALTNSTIWLDGQNKTGGARSATVSMVEQAALLDELATSAVT